MLFGLTALLISNAKLIKSSRRLLQVLEISFRFPPVLTTIRTIAFNKSRGRHVFGVALKAG